MGSTFNMSSLSKDKLDKLLLPIVFCINEEKVAFFTKGYSVLSINENLSKRLLGYECEDRNSAVADEFYKIIEEHPEPLLIKDFEILFDPEYQFDVLKLLIMVNRRKRIAVLWCGTYENGKLFFAELGYADCKSYNIADYDISCIN